MYSEKNENRTYWHRSVRVNKIDVMGSNIIQNQWVFSNLQSIPPDMWHSDTIGWVKTPNHSRYQAKTTHWDICIMSVQLQTRSKTVKAILLLPKEKLFYPFWKIQILSLRSLKTDYKWFSMIGFHANDSCKKLKRKFTEKLRHQALTLSLLLTGFKKELKSKTNA